MGRGASGLGPQLAAGRALPRANDTILAGAARAAVAALAGSARGDHEGSAVRRDGDRSQHHRVLHAHRAVLCVQPTIVMAQKFSRQRLSELLNLSPALADLMATPRGGERSNSILVKSGR